MDVSNIYGRFIHTIALGHLSYGLGVRLVQNPNNLLVTLERLLHLASHFRRGHFNLIFIVFYGSAYMDTARFASTDV